MSTSRVRIDTKRLDAMIAKVPGEAEKLVKAGALAIEGKAKTLAPVDTGYLKASIAARRQSELLWWVWAYAEYALYVELGTYKMAAKPYMIPAAEWARPQYIESWKRLLRIT